MSPFDSLAGWDPGPHRRRRMASPGAPRRAARSWTLAAGLLLATGAAAARGAAAGPGPRAADSPPGHTVAVQPAEIQARGAPAPRDRDAGPAAAVPDAREEARAAALEAKLKCPVCRTQSVRESDSFMAQEMQAKIRELIREGRSDEEVLEFFAERYGDYILLEPRKRGFGLAAYALPFAAVFAGVVFLLLGLRRRASGRGAGAVPAPPEVPGAGSPQRGGGGHSRPAAAGALAKPADVPPPATAEAPELSDADRERVELELKRYSV